jgi:Uma2 family endonuclease
MLMTTAELDAPASFLLDDFLSLDTPEGYRAELIDREIVVTPPPSGDHESLIWKIVRQVVRNGAVDMDFSGHKGLIIPANGDRGEGRFIPDGTFAAADLGLFDGAPSWMPAAGVAMIIEVTSRRPALDRNQKRRGYAAAGIPLYLLVDRGSELVTLFSEPSDTDYARTRSAQFSGQLELPKPFAFTLDLSAFRTEPGTRRAL